MPAGMTYDSIATTTLSASTSSVTFSSISGAYTDLILVYSGALTAGGENYYLRFNSDGNANYSDTRMVGNGSTAASYRSTNDTAGIVGNAYNSNGVIISQIMNYSNTSMNKTVLTRPNNAAQLASAHVTLWRSTSAITSIQVLLSGNSFASGATFSLYGITAA